MGFYVAFNTVQVISRWVVGRAKETSTYSSSGFCTVNCRPTASNYHLSHLRPCQESNPGLRGGRQECYHSTTVAPIWSLIHSLNMTVNDHMLYLLYPHCSTRFTHNIGSKVDNIFIASKATISTIEKDHVQPLGTKRTTVLHFSHIIYACQCNTTIYGYKLRLAQWRVTLKLCSPNSK